MANVGKLKMTRKNALDIVTKILEMSQEELDYDIEISLDVFRAYLTISVSDHGVSNNFTETFCMREWQDDENRIDRYNNGGKRPLEEVFLFIEEAKLKCDNWKPHATGSTKRDF